MRPRRGLSNLVLLALEKTVDGYVRFDDFINNPGFYAYGSDRFLRKSELAKVLKRLREGGLIEFIDDDKLVLRLTDKGKEEAIWANMKVDNKEWDGKWRLVIFDIPEKRRVARDLLRSKLKQWGFVHWQRSVWASKKDCTEILGKFIKFVGIEDWVIVVESENIGFKP